MLFLICLFSLFIQALVEREQLREELENMKRRMEEHVEDMTRKMGQERELVRAETKAEREEMNEKVSDISIHKFLVESLIVGEIN